MNKELQEKINEASDIEIEITTICEKILKLYNEAFGEQLEADRDRKEQAELAEMERNIKMRHLIDQQAFNSQFQNFHLCIPLQLGNFDSFANIYNTNSVPAPRYFTLEGYNEILILCNDLKKSLQNIKCGFAKSIANSIKTDNSES